jgi:hypothetical protein
MAPAREVAKQTYITSKMKWLKKLKKTTGMKRSDRPLFAWHACTNGADTQQAAEDQRQQNAVREDQSGGALESGTAHWNSGEAA